MKGRKLKKSKYQIQIDNKSRQVLIKKIISLYKSGLPMRTVGEQVGKSRTYVCRVIKEYLPTAFSVTSIDKKV